jgi:hypothetical protein
MVASRAGRLEMLNPEYSLLQPPGHE